MVSEAMDGLPSTPSTQSSPAAFLVCFSANARRAARPWVRFLLTFGPGVLASTEDQAPGWHLALPLSSRPAGLFVHEYISCGRTEHPDAERTLGGSQAIGAGGGS